MGEYDRGEQLAAERLAISREQGDQKLIASALLCLGLTVNAKGEHARASALYTEGADLAREQGDTFVLAMTINNLGDLAMHQGDYETARLRFEEALRCTARFPARTASRSRFRIWARSRTRRAGIEERRRSRMRLSVSYAIP
jgi:Tfp pilus assembly protein PilF